MSPMCQQPPDKGGFHINKDSQDKTATFKNQIQTKFLKGELKASTCGLCVSILTFSSFYYGIL